MFGLGKGLGSLIPDEKHITPEVKKDIEEKVEALKKVKESDNIEEMKSKTAELSEAIQKVGAELYKEEKKPEDMCFTERICLSLWVLPCLEEGRS